MEPLAWYIAGPLIGLTVPLLLLIKGKQLGVSSSFRVLGNFVLPKLEYFKYNRASDIWQVWFGFGVLLAAWLMFQFTDLGVPEITSSHAYAQIDPYSSEFLPVFFFGAIFVGFGARYANGCTAGHCIMGNAQFAPSSFIASIGFFVGGIIASHFVVPYIFYT